MEKTTNITELPLDVLFLVFPYLDAKSFLALTSTCKAFYDPSLRLDPTYWSYATRSTFRVPNQPVVQHDGARWQKMYRRMFTQSHVYTWGLNTQNRLGHAEQEAEIRRPMVGMRRPRPTPFRSHVAFPTEMDRSRELGVIADLQCGGWSTTILTSDGTLHTAGVINGETFMQQGRKYLTALPFPAGYPSSAAASPYHESTIAIRQFSAGRSHILGLSDSGRIWSWGDAEKAALALKFVNVDLREGSSRDAASHYGQVKQVVAGWSCSSAYIYGYGIVLWSPVCRNEEEVDTMLLLEHSEVPQSGYQRSQGASRENAEHRALGEEVGVVVNYIVLEQFIVFITDIGKVFCGQILPGNKVDSILELSALRNEEKTTMDIQGSFRRFAIFKNGEVIISEQSYLEACWSAQSSGSEQPGVEGLKRIPALQHTGVISVAFGDYHFLALHSSGKITTYGAELQSCGALGLGGDGGPAGRLRGIDHRGFSQDGRLLPHAYTHGRQIWFRPEQNKWIKHLAAGGKDPEESNERLAMFNDNRIMQGEVSEWVEQEGRGWDKNKGEDGLGAHFALRVSAAGWHSGAVVLVNEELNGKEVVYDWQNKSFPRLKLSDGTEMPGTVEFDEWREGRPEWKLDSSLLVL